MDTKMLCSECGKKINKERLQALPNTKTCVKCSKTEAKMGFITGDDTGFDVQVVDSEQVEKLRNYDVQL